MNRHLIYTNGRSGSNALINLLKQHPNVVNYGEVLGPWTTPGKYFKPLFRGANGGTRYLDFILGSRPAFAAVQSLSYLNRRRTGRPTVYRRWSDTQTLGIKEFAVNFHRNGLEQYLENNADLRLLVLLRENPVERYISYERLRQTGVVAIASGRNAGPQAMITVAPDRVVDDLDRFEQENELLRQAAHRHRGPAMVVRYEEYFGLDEDDQTKAGMNIQEFLGVDPLPLKTKHRKLRKGDLSESIANYAEFREVVASTKYARWLAH